MVKNRLPNKKLHVAIGLVIGASLGLHLLTGLLDEFVIHGYKWAHQPFHSTLEMAGSTMAIFIACLLLTTMPVSSRFGSRNGFIAAA